MKNFFVATLIYLISLIFFIAVIPLSAQNYSGYSDNSVLASGLWTKVSVNKSGIHRIPYTTLRSWGYADPTRVAVFGQGGMMLPRINSESRIDDLPELAVWHYNDAIYFYAHGPATWQWDSEKGIFIHKLHNWESVAYYFISDIKTTPRSVTTTPAQNLQPDRVIETYTYRDFHESDNISLIKSGSKLYGENFSVSGTLERSFSFQIPNRDESGDAFLYASAVSRSQSLNSFYLTVNDAASPTLTITLPATDLSRYDSYYAREGEGIASFNNGGSNLTIKVRFSDEARNAYGWLDFISINATARLQMNDDELQFRNPMPDVLNEVAEYRISGTNSSTVVWDVSDIVSPVQIALSHSQEYSSFIAKADTLREYVAFIPGASLPVPTFVSTVKNQNLHAIRQAHYVIVAPENFRSYAEELADIHRTLDNLTVEVISPEQLYNEFSWGHTDPTAIRSFMRMLYERSGKGNENAPRYLLLFGQGTYNPRSSEGSSRSLVVTYQSENSIHYTESYVTDDYFGFLDENEGADDRYDRLDIGIGRIPAENRAEAEIALNKIKKYIFEQDPGTWKKLVTFLADDGDYNVHMRDADLLAQKIEANNPEFDIRKIYLDNYRKTSTTTGERSPEVHDLAGRTVADGTLLFNFVGHGSVNGLAHEQVITKADIENWSNIKRLALFVTATCEFSRFDDPSGKSGGELLLLNPNGGAIALLSTTRLVYSGLNFQVNNSFFNHVFERDEDGSSPTLGSIIKNTKNNAGNSVNKLNFMLLGDPALRLIYPQNKVKTVAINHKAVTEDPDTLRALTLTHIKGEITDLRGEKIDSYNGHMDVVVYDKQREITTLGNGGATPFRYKNYSNVLFKGKATVVNGEFELSFMVPYDIRYNYAPGKISYYAYSEDHGEAFGAFKNVIIGGFNENASIDTKGPEIDLYLNHPGFKAGDMTGSAPIIYASIFDESGINTSASGIGHDITILLNGDSYNPIILNEYFVASPNDFRSGSITYQLPRLEPGRYTLSLKAWDNYNNSSMVETEFVVGSGNELTLRDFTMYPNPVTTGSTVNIRFNTDEANAALTILCEAISFNGRVTGSTKVQGLVNGNTLGPVSIDPYQLGIRAPGLYLLRFSIKSGNGKETQRIEKLLIK